MKVVEPGHIYKLDSLDGQSDEALTFVMRNDPPGKYPGNPGSHPGTTSQEVMRALIDRTLYVNDQLPHPDNQDVIRHLRECIWLLENRAAERHNLRFDVPLHGIEKLSTCSQCGHIVCPHQGYPPKLDLSNSISELRSHD